MRNISYKENYIDQTGNAYVDIVSVKEHNLNLKHCDKFEMGKFHIFPFSKSLLTLSNMSIEEYLNHVNSIYIY